MTDLLWPALGRSAKLVVYGLVLTVPLAIVAGMFAARRRNTLADRSIVTLGLASSSIPEFVSGVTLQYLIGVKLGWFQVLALAPRGLGPDHRSSTTSCCRRSPWSSSTSATSPG